MKDRARAALAALLHGADQEGRRFRFVSCQTIMGLTSGRRFFELKLTDIYEHGDYIDRRVGVLDKSTSPSDCVRCPSFAKR